MQLEATSRPQSAASLAAGSHPVTADSTIDLRASVQELLRRAFRSSYVGGFINRTDNDTVDAVRSVCAMARASDVRAETLILVIKTGWRQLPETRGMSRMDAEATLAVLITMCIKEYYAPQRRL